MKNITNKNEPKVVTILEKVAKVINRLFTNVASVLVIIMLVLIFQDVVRRYFFNDQTTWALDISRFLMVYVVFLALAPALQSGSHVSTDLVVSRLSVKSQYYLKLFVYLLCMVFGAILFWEVSDSTLSVIMDNRLFPVTVALPMKYIYIIGPIGTLQFIFTSIVCLLTSYYRERPSIVNNPS